MWHKVRKGHDTMENVLIWLFGALCGWLFSSAMDFISMYFKRKYEINKSRNSEKAFREKKHKDILLLEQGIPYFAPENVRAHHRPSDRFFIPFPQEFLDKFKQLSDEELSTFTRKSESFCELRVPGYSDEDIAELLEKSRMKIAQMFVDRTDGMYFNNLRFGVISSDSNFRTPDAQERMVYNVYLFQTDYFTHRVVEDLLDSITSSSVEISKETLNEKLSWLRTSLGLSVILRIPASNKILMTIRSREAAYTQDCDLFYVSVTETFSFTDYDYNGNPSLQKCLLRGLDEELGIQEYMVDMSSIRFLDSFYETHFHQDGFVATLDLKKKYTWADVVELQAKDKTLEVRNMYLLSDSRATIRKFIDENTSGNEWTAQAQTIFALESYLARNSRG